MKLIQLKMLTSFYKKENFDFNRLILHRDMVYDMMKTNDVGTERKD